MRGIRSWGQSVEVALGRSGSTLGAWEGPRRSKTRSLARPDRGRFAACGVEAGGKSRLSLLSFPAHRTVSGSSPLRPVESLCFPFRESVARRPASAPAGVSRRDCWRWSVWTPGLSGSTPAA